MAVTIGPAAILAILLGLLATGAVDFLSDDGSAQPLAWLAFVLVLAIVARDTLLGGTLLPGGRGETPAARGRLPGLELREGQVRLRAFDFEPVATTLAIILGLLASGAIDFHDGNGGGSAWAWTAFALSLFLATGRRLNRRPRAKPRERNTDDRAARFFEEMMRGIFEGRRPPGR
jgi:hypothetical protein